MSFRGRNQDPRPSVFLPLLQSDALHVRHCSSMILAHVDLASLTVFTLTVLENVLHATLRDDSLFVARISDHLTEYLYGILE